MISTEEMFNVMFEKQFTYLIDRFKQCPFSGIVLDCMRNRITNEIAGPALTTLSQALAEHELTLH